MPSDKSVLLNKVSAFFLYITNVVSFLLTHKRHKKHTSFNLHTDISVSKAMLFNPQDPILIKAEDQLQQSVKL